MSVTLRAPTPILVGVSGHRDLRDEDLPALCAAVDAFFADAAARYPHGDVVVLSGIASGADQLVAARARARGIAYVAVLPMPENEYRKDFVGAEIEPFEAALSGAAGVVELPFLPSVARERHYVALGEYLAAHSAILLALWNGKSADKPGGTSTVVAHALAGMPPTRDHETVHLCAYVYEIATPRASDRETVRAPFATNGFDLEHPTLQTLADVDGWNERAAAPLAIDAAICRTTFERADALAIRDQRKTHDAIDRFYWYTLASGLSLAAYGDLADLAPAYARALALLAVLFTAATIAAIITVRDIHAEEVQNRFQDDRVLAEGLRVQCALFEAGLGVEATQHYLASGGPELAWIRRALDVAYVEMRVAKATASGVASVPEWIVEQRRYFKNAAKKNSARAGRANRRALGWFRISFVAGVLIASDGIARVAFGFGLGHFVAGADAYVKPLLLTTLSSAGLLAAISKGKSALRGYQLLADRYERMYELFDSVERQLAAIFEGGHDARESATPLILQLAREALEESADWHSSERSRPLEFVWSG